MATFDNWIAAAAPRLPESSYGCFKTCPIAGADKYRLFQVGYIHNLASVGTSNQRHRRQRQCLTRRAFFTACRNYWCARRCLVRWRERRLCEHGSGAILATGEPLSSVPDHTLVRVVDGRTKHTFYVRDLLRHMNVRLQNSDYFISEPLRPTNPLTGLALSPATVARVILTAQVSPARIRIPRLVWTYWKCEQDIARFMVYELIALHELALENEAREGGVELVSDILPMYALAGTTEHCPCLAEANDLGLLDALVTSHRTALAQYFRATRSWCEYTAQQSRYGLDDHCTRAAGEYYRRTQAVRLRAQERAQYAPAPFNHPHPLADTDAAAMVLPDAILDALDITDLAPVQLVHTEGCLCGAGSLVCAHCRAAHDARRREWRGQRGQIPAALVGEVDRWADEHWAPYLS
jgi:hypothetical protein